MRCSFGTCTWEGMLTGDGWSGLEWVNDWRGLVQVGCGWGAGGVHLVEQHARRCDDVEIGLDGRLGEAKDTGPISTSDKYNR